MKIKFLKDYRYPGGGYSNKGDVRTFEDAEFAKWAIDNGFAEEVKESGWWRPEEDERYHFIDNNGDAETDRWCGTCVVDTDRFAIGNCFKTAGAAERWRDYLKSIATVRQDEGVLTPEQVNELIKNEDLAYYVGRGNGETLCGCTMDFEDCWMPVGVILFDSEEHVDRSLRKHPDEWKIVVNYDWSRE